MAQGIILGPLIFNLRVNEPIHLSPDVDTAIYADDDSLSFAGADLSNIFRRANCISGDPT